MKFFRSLYVYWTVLLFAVTVVVGWLYDPAKIGSGSLLHAKHHPRPQFTHSDLESRPSDRLRLDLGLRRSHDPHRSTVAAPPGALTLAPLLPVCQTLSSRNCAISPATEYTRKKSPSASACT